jgi:hypothetical protein
MARFAVSIVTLNRLRCCPGEGARAVAEAPGISKPRLIDTAFRALGDRSSPLRAPLAPGGNV